MFGRGVLFGLVILFFRIIGLVGGAVRFFGGLGGWFRFIVTLFLKEYSGLILSLSISFSAPGEQFKEPALIPFQNEHESLLVEQHHGDGHDVRDVRDVDDRNVSGVKHVVSHDDGFQLHDFNGFLPYVIVVAHHLEWVLEEGFINDVDDGHVRRLRLRVRHFEAVKFIKQRVFIGYFRYFVPLEVGFLADFTSKLHVN